VRIDEKIERTAAPKLLVLMLPDLRFLRIEPPIDDCVVQEA